MKNETIKTYETLFNQYKEKLINILGSEEEYKKQISQTLFAIMDDKTLFKLQTNDVFNLILKSYELGIPYNSQKFCYIIPRDGVILIPTAKGYRKKALENKNIEDVVAKIIYEGDDFKQSDDSTNGVLYKYTPDTLGENYGDIEKIKGAYCVIIYKNGRKNIEVMSLKQLEKVKTKATTGSVYKDFREEMYRKIVMKRALKLEVIPETIELDNLDNKIYNFDDKKNNSINDIVSDYKEKIEFDTIKQSLMISTTINELQENFKIFNENKDNFSEKECEELIKIKDGLKEELQNNA